MVDEEYLFVVLFLGSGLVKKSRAEVRSRLFIDAINESDEYLYYSIDGNCDEYDNTYEMPEGLKCELKEVLNAHLILFRVFSSECSTFASASFLNWRLRIASSLSNLSVR